MNFLTQGEKVYKKTRPSRRSPLVIRFYVLTVVVLALSVSLLTGLIIQSFYVMGYDVVFYAGLGLLGLVPLVFLIGESKRKMRGEYVITNLRIIVKTGFLRTTIDSVTNKMIINVRGVQSLWQKLLGIGNVEITTSKGGKEVELLDISGYKQVENLIYKLMESRGGMGEPAAEAPQEPQQQAAPPAQTPPVQAQQPVAQPVPQQQPPPTPSPQRQAPPVQAQQETTPPQAQTAPRQASLAGMQPRPMMRPEPGKRSLLGRILRRPARQVRPKKGARSSKQ